MRQLDVMLGVYSVVSILLGSFALLIMESTTVVLLLCSGAVLLLGMRVWSVNLAKGRAVVYYLFALFIVLLAMQGYS